MPWTQERTYINQKVQVGAESTSALGTPVAANRLLQCFEWVFGVAADVQVFTPTGRKYVGTAIENLEWVDGTLGGILDYNGIIYPLGMCMGAVSPVTHGVSTTAKDWIFTPPLSGSIVPQTLTIQQGDTSTRAHQLAYGLLTEWGYKGDRKSGISINGKVLAQPISDGITMTGSPTSIALAPLAAKHVNVYLDSSFANLGVTQLLKVLNVDFVFTNVAGPFYPFNRANLGWTAHVDLKPTTTIKLLLEADATGMSELTNLQQSSTQFLRVQGQGLVIDNLQTVSLGSPSAGTFTLTYKAQTTAGIAFNATSATVQTALTGLSTVGVNNATVSGSAGGPYSVNFVGTLAQDTTAMTGSGAGLTGGTFSITQNQSYNIFQHDMAVKVQKPNPFSDKDGIFAEEWELVVIEDSASGLAQKVTVTNLLTTL